MADWSDYYSGQRVDSLARCVALRHHDARVGGSVPGLGSFNTVTLQFLKVILTTEKVITVILKVISATTQ